MKLSQAILISLSLLICFSLTLSLAMDYHSLDINEVQNRDALVSRLKNKNIELFKSFYDLKHKNPTCLKKTFKCLVRVMRCCCIKQGLCVIICGIGLLVFVLQVLPFIIAYSVLNDSTLKDVMKNIALPLGCVNGLFFLLALVVFLWDINLDELDVIDDFDFNKDIQYKNIDTIRKNLQHINKFKDFNASKYLFNAIIYEMPDDIIETLFDKGGNFISERFRQVITYASFEMVKFLVDLGIDVNIKDLGGNPVIMGAIVDKNLAVIDLLLAKGVDVGVTDHLGQTVADYLNEIPEVESHLIKEKFRIYKQRIAEQIYKDLEEFQFPRVEADLISEYLV